MITKGGKLRKKFGGWIRMTAEIAVLNKHAVALAADSAVTNYYLK